MTRKIHVKFYFKTDNMILNYGNSLVLHCEHQDTYPGNQGEVI